MKGFVGAYHSWTFRISTVVNCMYLTLRVTFMGQKGVLISWNTKSYTFILPGHIRVSVSRHKNRV